MEVTFPVHAKKKEKKIKSR